MRRSSMAEIIGAIEPTFQAHHPWCGQWMLGGRPAYVRADDEWLEARMPLCGDTGTLLASQHGLAGLAKVAAGDYLRAELPVGRADCADAFRTLCGELERGLDHFEGVPESAVASTLSAENLAECLSASGVAWSPKGGAFSTPLEDDPAPTSFAIAEALANAIAVRATMVRLHRLNGESMKALNHFLLVLNQRIRLARGSMAPDRVVLEVVLPASCAKPALVKQAVRSLWTGAAAVRRECAALVDPEIAEAYLQFHLKGANA
jgi:hypothetical protein